MAGLDNSKDRAVAIMLLQMGYKQHRIAGFFDVNGGRIAELSTATIVYKKPGSKPNKVMDRKLED